MAPLEHPYPKILNAQDLKYKTEGAANVIYEYLGKSPELSGKLLRLRKRHITSPSTTTLKRFTEGKLVPLLGDLVLPTSLVLLGDRVTHQLNERLLLEKRTKRSVTLLDEHESFALAMEDLSAAIEFKPKWLVQSVSAPVDWTTCRTCAMRLMKNQRASFCPLQLAESEAEDTLKTICKEPWFVETVVTSGVLRVLASLQSSLDSVGPLEALSDNQAFMIAMTLRDCSIFVLPGRLYVADLDLKDWDGGKGVYWRETERALIAGGYYHQGGCREGEELDESFHEDHDSV